MRSLIERLPGTFGQVMLWPEIQRASAVSLFLDRVEELRMEDPSAALFLAEAGRTLASKLRFCKSAKRREVLAKSFMVSGGIARTLADLDFAEAAYICAHRLLKAQHDPHGPLMVELMGRWAFLRRDQRQFETARKIAEHGLALARRNGDQRLIGRSLVHLANAIMDDKPAEAIPLFRDALSKLDRQKDSTHIFSTCQCLGVTLCGFEDSDPREILSLSKQASALAKTAADRYHCQWLRARSLMKVGSYEAALVEINQVGKGLEDLGITTYAAAARLDSAACYLQLGDSESTRRVARGAYTLFGSMNLGRDAMAALTLFKRALLKNDLTLEIIHKLRKHLEVHATRSESH